MVERTSAQDMIKEPYTDLIRDGEDLKMAVFQENRPDHIPLKKLCADDRVSTPVHNSDDMVPAHKHIDRSKVDDTHIQTPLVRIADQNAREGPGPGFRGSKHGARCLWKTLTSEDVIPINPELHISADDAYILSCSKKIVKSVPGSCNTSLVVFDKGHMKYNMTLSKYVCGNLVGYSISRDWERFVKAHNLKAGDKMSFYRTVEKNDSGDQYYMLKYVRECSDNEDVDAQKIKRPRIKFDHKKVELKVRNHGADSVDNKKKRDLTMPYFCSQSHHMRAMTREAYYLSKTLISIEVDHKNPNLYFDPYEASVLTDTPEIGRYPLSRYSKVLQVFDKNGRIYFMTLTHCISGGEIRSYCISAGWKRFRRAHKLKEGDVLTFYRFRDTAASKLKYYYVLKYFRKPPDVVDQCMSHKASDNVKITWKGTISMKKKQKPKVGDDEDPMENACDQKKINTREPDYRDSTHVVYCLSKTLSACGLVHEGNIKPCFDANEAWLLTDCPRVFQDHPLGTFLMNLVVFDLDGRKYDMVLSCGKRCDDDGELVYTLDSGWQRFVRDHNLKAGDEISIYRSRKKSAYGEFRYFIM